MCGTVEVVVRNGSVLFAQASGTVRMLELVSLSLLVLVLLLCVEVEITGAEHLRSLGIGGSPCSGVLRSGMSPYASNCIFFVELSTHSMGRYRTFSLVLEIFCCACS